MKRPYFNLEERLDIKNDTINGNHLKFRLAWEKFKRSVRQDNNCLLAEFIIRYIGNIKLEIKFK